MPPVELVYPPVVGLTRVLFRALGLRIELTGAEHVPLTGPVVLASNHISFLDFTLVGLAARPRRVRFLTRHDAFDHWAAGPLLRGMHHVAVDRAAPAAAYLASRRLLERGEAVGLFPEAGISQAYDVRALMPGAVALAAATGAPLVPVAIWGPQRIATARRPIDLTRGRPVSITVGEPVRVAPDADVVAGTVDLGTTMQAMLDRLQALPRHQPEVGEEAPWHPAQLGGSAPTRAEAAPRESVPRSAVRWWEPVAAAQQRPGGPGPAAAAPQAPVATGRVGSEIQPLQLPG
jgi:1-acyl-sn-glycerol-3-phosphate acyltransferase